jgi:uncharacterized protein YciI
VLLVLIGFLVVALVVLALLPMLISGGLGRGTLLSMARGQIGQPVSLQGLQLAWMGSQELRGLEVGAPGADLHAKMDLRVDSGLVDLLMNRGRGVSAAVGGSVDARLGSGGGGARPPAEIKLPPMPFDIHVNDLDLTLRQPGRDEPLKIEGLDGVLSYAPGGELRVTGKAQLASAEADGEVAFEGTINKAFDGAGAFTPAGASLRLQLEAPEVHLAKLGAGSEIRGLVVSANSDDLTRELRLALRGESRTGSEGSPLQGDVTIRELLNRDGTVHIDVAKISGRVSARRLPSAAFDPLLAATPLVPSRDAGPYLDVEAEMAEGAGHEVRLHLEGAACKVDAQAVIDPAAGIVDGRKMRLEASAHPQLLAAVGLPGVAQALPFVLDVQRFRVPSAAGKDLLRQVQAEGRLTAAGPLRLETGGGRQPVQAGNLDLAFTADGQKGLVTLRGTAEVADAAAAADLQLADLFDAAGAIRTSTLWPAGTVTVRGVSPQTLANQLPEAHRDALFEVLSRPVDLKVDLARAAAGDSVQVHVTGGVEAALAAVRRDQKIHVEKAEARVTCTPQMAAALQKGRELPVELVEDAVLELSAQPFDLDEQRLLAGDFKNLAVPLRYAVDKTRLRFPQPALPGLAVHGLDGTVTLASAQPIGLETAGQAEIRGLDGRAVVGPLEFSGKLTLPPGAPPVMTARAVAKRLDLQAAEQLVPAVARARPWTGDHGSADLTFENGKDGWKAGARLASDRIREAWIVKADPKTTTLSAENPAITLNAGLLAKFGLIPAAGAGGAKSKDVVVTPQIRALAWPTAMMMGQPFDPAAVNIDASLALPDMALSGDRSADPTVLENIALQVKGSDLSAGVKIEGQADVRGAGSKGAGARVDFTVAGLASAQGLADPAAVCVTGLAKLTDLPTAIVDGFAGLDGLLVAAIGQQAIATLQAADLSRNAGQVSAKFRSVYGSLNVPEMRASEGRLLLSEDWPAKAQLRVTPDLRQRLLRKLHPILADIETSAQPLQATIQQAAVPLDGDLSRLDAKMELSIGDVQFRPSALVLAAMDASGGSGRETVPGRIEDVKINIRGGVVQYERFLVHIENLDLAYSGTIDLRTGQLNLRHEVPLAVLAEHVPELRGYVESLHVPLLTRGTTDNPQTSIDPSFDLTSGLLENTVNKALDDLLGVEEDEDTRKEDAPQQGQQQDPKKKRQRRPR